MTTPFVCESDDYLGLTPLHDAIIEMDIETIKKLLEQDDIEDYVNETDAEGDTPLHYAVIRENFEIVKLLVQCGADVNAENNICKTPLHEAVKSGTYEMVDFLIENCADVNVMDDPNNTPLHYARDEIMCEILLKAGADVSIENEFGYTPITELAMIRDKNENHIAKILKMVLYL